MGNLEIVAFQNFTLQQTHDTILNELNVKLFLIKIQTVINILACVFRKSRKLFRGPKSYVVCKMFTNKDSVFVDFEIQFNSLFHTINNIYFTQSLYCK